MFKVLILTTILFAAALIQAQAPTTGGGGSTTGGGSSGGSGGHYDVTYSSPDGLWTSTGSYGTASGPYTVTSSSVGASATSGGLYTGGMFGGGLGTASVSGTVKAHYVWNDGGNATSNPPPQCAIVKETTNVSWSGTSGQCEDGFGAQVPRTTHSQVARLEFTTPFIKTMPLTSPLVVHPRRVVHA